jgi:hypothetical protein
VFASFTFTTTAPSPKRKNFRFASDSPPASRAINAPSCNFLLSPYPLFLEAMTDKLPSTTAAPVRPWFLLATIALVAGACFHFPDGTFTQILDSSWGAVLVYAREKGLQFGRDIVFTYGPLGFLAIHYFSPYAAVARIFFEIAFGLGIATGLCLLAWRLTLPWRIAMLAFFIFVATPYHLIGDALYLDTGLFAWAFLCFLDTGPRLRPFVCALVILAAVGALVKFTYLITGCFTIGLVACDLALRRRRTLATAMIFAFICAFLLGWLLLGQKLSSLGPYIFTSFAVAGGYNAAMGGNSVNLAWVLGMSLAALAVVLIRVPAARWPVPRCAVFLCWLAGLLFVQWKYGCVRADANHVVLMLGVVPVAALALEALPPPGKRLLLFSRAATVLCVAAALLFMQSQFSSFVLVPCLRQTGHNLSRSFSVLTRPARYLRDQTQAFRDEQAREQFPQIRAAVGPATADIFGLNQEFAVPNQLNYVPRPVFQSYAAYNRALTDLNQQFYLSPGSPQFVLCALQSIDGWFPPLADSTVLRHLLANYRLAGIEGDYLLLRRNKTAGAQLTLLKEGTILSGEKLPLPSAPGNALWLELDLKPSLFGRLRQFLYKPQQTRFIVWNQSDPATPLSYRAPAPMLSAGFLVSPLLLSTQDIADLYLGGQSHPAAACAVEIPPALLASWRSPIQFRLYRLENGLPDKLPPH